MSSIVTAELTITYIGCSECFQGYNGVTLVLIISQAVVSMVICIIMLTVDILAKTNMTEYAQACFLFQFYSLNFNTKNSVF